jgi:hypothetical protein
VKEQKNLLLALESDDPDTIERNIRQVLSNCTITPGINIDKLPVVDVELYFLHLRARSIGEIVESDYICNNQVDGKECGGKMKSSFNLLDIGVDIDPKRTDTIQLTDTITVKLKYPEFSLVKRLKNMDSAVEIAFEIIADSIEHIYDGEQYYYAEETVREDLMQFLESLDQEQFSKLEKFFNELPIINKKVQMKCGKCGFDHSISLQGLESFFG